MFPILYFYIILISAADLRSQDKTSEGLKSSDDDKKGTEEDVDIIYCGSMAAGKSKDARGISRNNI